MTELHPRRATARATWALALSTLGACATGPGLDESAPLEGRDVLEKLSFVSQLDLLDETRADYARCSAAATLSAYLLLGGSFEAAAARHGVDGELTFGNVHRLQEALYRLADRDGEPGIFGASVARYDDQGQLTGWDRHVDDEYQAVLDALGLSMDRVYAPTRADKRDKRAAVQAWLERSEPVVFVVGVDEDTERERFVPMHERGNHYVIVFRWSDRFYALDSYRTPGRSALVPLSEEEVEDNLLYTPNALFVVWR